MLQDKNTIKIKSNEEYSILNYHVLESMADWVRVVDYEGNVLYVNKAMKEDSGNMVDNKCYTIHGRSQPCGFCISKRSIRTKETIQKEEMINGRFFSVKSSPVFDEDGSPIGAVEVFRDVTRERRLEIELIEKNKKMNNDLLFAKKVQERILPVKGEYEKFKIDYLYKPSEMLSGDMFDIFRIDDDNLGIYISDVAGHGITASMMTMFIRQTMRSLIFIKSPAETLIELQDRFSGLNLGAEKYFTIFYGIYNIKTGVLKYTNAGHNCVPIKFNKYNEKIELLESNGLPITLIFDELEYKEEYITLEKGDELLFYTDGITEIKNFDGVEFGTESIIGILKNKKYDIINTIAEKVEAFRWGEQKDDFAMLLVEIL